MLNVLACAIAPSQLEDLSRPSQDIRGPAVSAPYGIQGPGKLIHAEFGTNFLPGLAQPG